MNKKDLTKKQMIVWCLVLAAIAIFTGIATALNIFADEVMEAFPVTVYDGPAPLEPMEGIDIRVNDTPIFVYKMPVNNSHSWATAGDPPVHYAPMAYYDCDGTANVEIMLEQAPETVLVRPLSAGIEPKINNGTVSFDIDRPGQYIIEFNGRASGAVHLFVNPIEKDIPDEDDENVIFIGPGLWDIGNFSLESNETLYISGGAVVYGAIRAEGAQNVVIRGRGILDGSVYESWTHPGSYARVPVSLSECEDSLIDGIICVNPNAWTINGYKCVNTRIHNVKIISSRQNGDGITLQSCKDVTISDSFVRSWDDSLVVKNYAGSSDNITFSNIIVWTDLAQSCEVGYETNKGKWPKVEIRNVTFEDITVLHNFHKPVISIHNADDAVVRNITFRNIIVEDAQMGEGDAGENKQLIDIGIMSSSWSSTRERGHIRDILIENVIVLDGKTPPVSIKGYDEEHTVENVTIRGLTVKGQSIRSLEGLEFQTNQYTSGIILEGVQ